MIRRAPTFALLVPLLAAACADEEATPLWVDAIDVYPSTDDAGALACGIRVEDSDAAPKCGDGAQGASAKCMSWETMNPVSGGTVVADQAVTSGGAEVAAGDDLAAALFGDEFPRELYTYDEYALTFAADVTLADGTTLSFSWSDADGNTFADTLSFTGGALVE